MIFINDSSKKIRKKVFHCFLYNYDKYNFFLILFTHHLTNSV